MALLPSFLDDDFVVPDRRGRPLSLAQANELKFHTPGYDRVGKTHLRVDGVPVAWVSTVWLGPLYPYGIFETMVFSDLLGERQWRWRTLRAAEIGHRRVVRQAWAQLRCPVALARPHRHGRW